MCVIRGRQPYLCGSVTPRRRKLVEILTVVHFISIPPHPEVNTSCRLPPPSHCVLGVCVCPKGGNCESLSRYAICKAKTERIEHFQSQSATSPPHFQSQYRLGNVVRCCREALSCLEGVEGCNHLDFIGYVSLCNRLIRFCIEYR